MTAVHLQTPASELGVLEAGRRHQRGCVRCRRASDRHSIAEDVSRLQRALGWKLRAPGVERLCGGA
eukprot:12205099-Alexandrium_andersonii.AAC.1